MQGFTIRSDRFPPKKGGKIAVWNVLACSWQNSEDVAWIGTN